MCVICHGSGFWLVVSLAETEAGSSNNKKLALMMS